jgi:hypothetical protein
MNRFNTTNRTNTTNTTNTTTRSASLIIAVDRSSTSRQRAITAAHLAASLHRPLHLVSGQKQTLSHVVVHGNDEFFCDPLCATNEMLAQLESDLAHITAVTSSALAMSPRAALRSECKRLGATPVLTHRHVVARIAAHLQPAEVRPILVA